MKFRKCLALFGAVCLMLGAASCSKSDEKGGNSNAKVTNAEAAKKMTALLPNYRYVDSDSLLSKYNLAKDYDEELLKLQTSMENTIRAKQNSLANMQAAMQKKYQNNEYQTETQVRNEQKRLESEAQKADKEVAALQSNYQNTAMQYQQIINDSIQNFIKRYNASRGYDAIFFKNATLFINPELDITDEVLQGLNAAYNKK